MKKRKNRKERVKTVRMQAFRACDYVIICFCILGIVAGGVGIYLGSVDYRKADSEYAELGQYVRSVGDIGSVGTNAIDLTLTEPGEVAADISDRMFEIDWAALRAINSDIVGWIVIPGTPINYPIVQTVDNSTYLHKSFEGTKNACGTIFLDTYNHSDFSDWNSVIYGHNMKNGSMFAYINKYKNEEFYQEHKDVWLLTPYWERKYQIVSAHPAQDGSETYSIVYPEGAYQAHVASEVSQSNYDTGTGYNVDMPMITLSTCTGRGLLSRFVLNCQPVYETRLNPFIENVVTETSDE